MKLFKVLKPFQSPLVGNKIKGEVFPYGEDSAKKWVDLGLIEEDKAEAKPQTETKPEIEPTKETKPQKNGKKANK